MWLPSFVLLWRCSHARGSSLGAANGGNRAEGTPLGVRSAAATVAAMSADETAEFAGFERRGSADGGRGADDRGSGEGASDGRAASERPDAVRPAEVEAEENMTLDENRDPDQGSDPTTESGTENAADDEVTDGEDEEGLLAPGSTAEGAGTVLGAVPVEARRGAAPLGEHDGEALSSQLADERWRTNGRNPLG